jgi:RND family efflux transporter MFP subunit
VRLSDEEQQSRVRQAEADRDSMQAQLQLAKIEFDRAAQLIASRSISQAEYDTARTRVQTTQANFDRATRAVEEAKVFLGFATIVAPFSGIVVDKVVEQGDTVSPGQTLLTLYDPTHMQLVASVRESLAMKLKVGQELPARLESLGYDCYATVSEVVPKADASNRSFDVKVTGPCPTGVYSGMFARLMLPLEDEQLLLLPKVAVARVGQLTMVHVAVGETLVRRAVQLGRSFGDQVEVLSGLTAGEKVLLATNQPVEEGTSP